MSRSHFYRTIQSMGGSTISGASVTVCAAGTVIPIAGPLYADASSASTLSNPFIPTNGVIDFYLAAPQDICLQINYGSASLLVDYQPVLPQAHEIVIASASSYAENISGTPTVGVSGGSILIPTTAITIAPTTSAMLLQWSLTATITSAGLGQIGAALVEITGAPTELTTIYDRIEDPTIDTNYNKTTISGSRRVSGFSTARLFALYLYVWQPGSGSLLQASALNAADAPSWLLATTLQ
jgi:hypothetical protein